jgi:hypothetical protein
MFSTPAAAPPAAPDPRLQRHALGLPAGSIRALLALGVLGYLWLLVLRPGEEGRPLLDANASLAFIYLQFLMVLILAHFFTAHGKTIGSHVSTRSPLGLPGGTVRLILLAGYLGLAVYLYQTQPAFQAPETGPVILLLLVLVSAFFFGHLLTALVRFLSRGVLPPWFQDIQAWFALIALFLLGAIVLIRFVINTSVPLESRVGLAHIEVALAGFVGFYFGARS